MSLPEQNNELEWSAFCYAAGELTAEEVAAFEQRLGDDQSAREALARAVELTQAVVSAESLAPAIVVRSSSSAWGRRLAWMAIGSAASLLAALLWTGSGMGPQVTAWLSGSSERSHEAGQLAQAWSETREELAVASDADLWYPAHVTASDAGAAAEVEAAEDLAADDSVTAIDTPAWLATAAVEFAEQPDRGDRDPFDAERLEN